MIKLNTIKHYTYKSKKIFYKDFLSIVYSFCVFESAFFIFLEREKYRFKSYLIYNFEQNQLGGKGIYARKFLKYFDKYK